MLTQVELGQYLQELRKKQKLSLRKVDDRTDISYSHLNMIEHGNRNVTPALLKTLAIEYKVDYLDLYEKAGYIDLVEYEKRNKINTVRIPVLGRIPAGVPIEMIEDIGEFEDISEDMLKGDKKYFALKINEENGNSMEPDYKPGDILIILKQDNCENGEDCIISINGSDATFKRIFRSESGIILQPLNNSYIPIIYSNDDIDKLPIKILGIVVELRRQKRK